MKWKKNVRATGLIEYVCPCGVGHPTNNSALEMAKKYGSYHTEEELKEEHDSWLVHGCCHKRCCNRKDFPGKNKNSNYNGGKIR